MKIIINIFKKMIHQGNNFENKNENEKKEKLIFHFDFEESSERNVGMSLTSEKGVKQQSLVLNLEVFLLSLVYELNLETFYYMWVLFS